MVHEEAHNGFLSGALPPTPKDSESQTLLGDPYVGGSLLDLGSFDVQAVCMSKNLMLFSINSRFR